MINLNYQLCALYLSLRRLSYNDIYWALSNLQGACVCVSWLFGWTNTRALWSPGFVHLVDQAKQTKTPNEQIAKLFFTSRSSYLNLLSKGLLLTSLQLALMMCSLLFLHLFYFVVLVSRWAQPTVFAYSYWLIVVVTCYSRVCHVWASAIMCVCSLCSCLRVLSSDLVWAYSRLLARDLACNHSIHKSICTYSAWWLSRSRHTAQCPVGCCGIWSSQESFNNYKLINHLDLGSDIRHLTTLPDIVLGTAV